jgi:hypothetical protein
MAGARPLPLAAQLEFLGSVEVVVVAVVDVVLRVLFGTGFAAAWCDGLEPHALKPTAMPATDTQRAVSTEGRSGSLVSDLERRAGCPSLSLHNVVSKPKPPSCIAIAHFACSEDPPTPPETDETLGDARSGSPAPPSVRGTRSSEACERLSGACGRQAAPHQPDRASVQHLSKITTTATALACRQSLRCERLHSYAHASPGYLATSSSMGSWLSFGYVGQRSWMQDAAK